MHLVVCRRFGVSGISIHEIMICGGIMGEVRILYNYILPYQFVSVLLHRFLAANRVGDIWCGLRKGSYFRI
jgi:hypothetical protein